jgi:hypothetical protein
MPLRATLALGVIGYVVITTALNGTGGAPLNVAEAPGNLLRLQGESHGIALPLMILVSTIAGSLALVLASREGHLLGAMLGAVGAYASMFLGSWAGNDFVAPLLIAQLTVVWSWAAVAAGAVVPLAYAALTKRHAGAARPPD